MFKGKAIYQPKSKAAEYGQWAVNFYKGCSGDCSYCYLKKYPMSQFWSTTPTLKKGLVNESTAIKIFEKELIKNLPELQKHGLFFNFSSDPFLPEAIKMTRMAVVICNQNDVPCKFLTKQTDWLLKEGNTELLRALEWNDNHSFGFTLTGHDELEPGCASNDKRIDAMSIISVVAKTWASIEPVIDMKSSSRMIRETKGICDHYKIGLESGKKFDPVELRQWINFTNQFIENTGTIYWKDSLLKAAGVSRDELPSNCVGRDYNLFG